MANTELRLLKQDETTTAQAKYQQTLLFKTPEQAKHAEEICNQVNLIPLNMHIDGNTLSLATPYTLGIIMRNILKYETQPTQAWWNCQPGTRDTVPLLRRVSIGQILLTVGMLASTCGSQFIGDRSPLDFWSSITTGILFTMLAAFLSADIIRSVKSCFSHRKAEQAKR